MTAAFCLAGEPRSFIVPAVYLSIQHNLIEAFGATGDVFAYLRVGSARQAGPSRELRRALQALQPRRVGYGNSTLEPGCAVRGQAEAIVGCYRLVTAQERSDGTQYTWVMRVRPDVMWISPLPPAPCFGEADVVTRRDVFVMARRPFAEELFGPRQLTKAARAITCAKCCYEWALRGFIVRSGAPRVRFWCPNPNGCDRMHPGGKPTRFWHSIPCQLGAVIVRLNTREGRGSTPDDEGGGGHRSLYFIEGCGEAYGLREGECGNHMLSQSEEAARQQVLRWRRTRSCESTQRLVEKTFPDHAARRIPWRSADPWRAAPAPPLAPAPARCWKEPVLDGLPPCLEHQVGPKLTCTHPGDLALNASKFRTTRPHGRARRHKPGRQRTHWAPTYTQAGG